MTDPPTPRFGPETRAKMRVSWTPERRAAQSARMKQRWTQPTYRAKMGALNRGRHHSPETRHTLSEKVAAHWTRERRRVAGQESLKHHDAKTPLGATGSAEATANDAPQGGG